MVGDDWPALEYPPKALAGFGETEVLESLLSLVSPSRDAQHLAADLMRQFGTLAKVLSAQPTEYGHHKGASPHVATLFALLWVTVEKVLEPKPDRRRRFTREAPVKSYFARRLPVPPDRVRVLFLDRNYRFIADETLPNHFAREVVGRAFMLNAYNLVLVGRDDGLFQRIHEIGRLMQVNVCGFIRDGPKPTPAQLAGRINREKAIENPFASSRLPRAD